MKSVEQERNEAVLRAVAKPAWRGLAVCIGVTLVIAFAFGMVGGYLGPSWLPGVPDWMSFAVIMAPFGLAVVTLPNLSQLLVLRGDNAKAIEALNAWAFGETAAYIARTGRKPPAFYRGIASARRWLPKGEGYGTRFRIRTLIWVGELDAAAQVIAAMPFDDPADAFHRSLLREFLQFVATGSMDLARPHALLERIPVLPEREQAALNLAFEEARLEHATRGDPLAPLARAREHLSELPKGASIKDRLISGLPLSIVPFAFIALTVWLVTRF